MLKLEAFLTAFILASLVFYTIAYDSKTLNLKNVAAQIENEEVNQDISRFKHQVWRESIPHGGPIRVGPQDGGGTTYGTTWTYVWCDWGWGNVNGQSDWLRDNNGWGRKITGKWRWYSHYKTYTFIVSQYDYGEMLKACQAKHYHYARPSDNRLNVNYSFEFENGDIQEPTPFLASKKA